MVGCPHCGNQQPESVLAISTFCRCCGHHFEIGKTSRPESGRQRPADAPETPSSAHRSVLDILARNGFESVVDPIKRSLAFTREHLASLTTRIGKVVPALSGPRPVHCFECDSTHSVPATATSTSCPKCGAHISLADIDVSESQTLEASTQGDVVVRKNVTLVGGATCRHLIVRGKILGRIRCSGVATFLNSGHVLGRVHCGKIVVARGISLRFATTVVADEIEILGEATGDFTCHGTLTIGKKGSVHGTVATLALVVEPGGALDGELRVLTAASPSGLNPDLPSAHVLPPTEETPLDVPEDSPVVTGGEAHIA